MSDNEKTQDEQEIRVKPLDGEPAPPAEKTSSEEKTTSEPAQKEGESCAEGEHSCCCCHATGWLKGLFLPQEAEGELQRGKLKAAPGWLTALAAIALFVMLNQVKIPLAGGKLAFADLAFLASFLPVLGYAIASRRRLFFPICTIFVLIVACIANLTSAPGMGGTVEVAQLVQQLFCGTILLGFLIENAPGAAVGSVLLAIAVNIVAALIQGQTYGFGSTFPPADIMALKWGCGHAYTGLFRSRMALAFFLAISLAWIQPILFGRKRIYGFLAAFVATVVGLLAIPHGQMLFIVGMVLVIGAFIHSRAAGLTNVLAMAVALFLSTSVFPPAHNQARLASLNPMKTGDYPGELKTNHIDFAAALGMAARRPLSGVGSGRYQQCVGRCYGDLPNPSYNDIETDTQASWGILTGTMGFPTAALMLVLLAGAAANGVRRFMQSKGRNCIALGGALALVVVILGMFVSDPLTRGLGWMIALALASTSVPNPEEEVCSLSCIAPGSIVACGVVLGLLLAGVALRAKTDDPLAGTTRFVNTAEEGGAQTGVASQEESVFKIIDAGDVVKFTAPVEKGTDSQAFKNTVLKILDGKGTPPDDKEPAMDFGGAQFDFELSADAECKVWLRVWWDGSCGNTINLQMDDEPKSITVGNDGTYRTWHWLEAPKIYKLASGKHSLFLLNREDGIMFDQLLITNDHQYVPQGIEEE